MGSSPAHGERLTDGPPAARGTSRVARRLAIATVGVLAATTFTASAAGAQEGCGEYSYGFAGTRLINDGISNTAGPFAIDLPEGTYTVTLVSHDEHDTQGIHASQPAEQYRVVLDSGYVSPPSVDVPDDQDTITTVHAGQDVPASTAISVHHLGVGGVNSVDVLCVGFTTEAPEPAPVEPEEPGTAEPDMPATTEPDTEEPAPVQDIIEPITIVNDDADPGATPPTATASDDPPTTELTEPITVEVEGKVEEAPLLAITGPPMSLMLISVGLAMIALGVGLVSRERQLSES